MTESLAGMPENNHQAPKGNSVEHPYINGAADKPVDWSPGVGLYDEKEEDGIPSAKDSRLTNFRKSSKDTIWGREWEIPHTVTLRHPPGKGQGFSHLALSF